MKKVNVTTELKEAKGKGAVKPPSRISAFEKWLATFIEEKGLDLDHEFVYFHNEVTHFMTLDALIEIILKASKKEQDQIKDKLVYIDFRNGNVMHFFNFLGEAYIKTNY